MGRQRCFEGQAVRPAEQQQRRKAHAQRGRAGRRGLGEGCRSREPAQAACSEPEAGGKCDCSGARVWLSLAGLK